MEPVVVLEYRGASEARPRWVTRLGVASIVLGTLGAVGGLARANLAWLQGFDPGSRFAYLPLPWVSPAHLAAWLALAAACAILAMAGIISLTKRGPALRLHLWCAALVLALVVLTATLGAIELLPHPETSAARLAAGALGQCATWGAYPIVVIVLLRRSKSRGVAPAA